MIRSPEKMYSVDKDAEYLSAHNTEEAIDEYIDNCWYLTENTVLDWVLTVWEWEREDQPEPSAEHIIDDLLEQYSELLSPDDDSVPDALWEAADAWAEAITQHLPVWTCSRVRSFKTHVQGRPSNLVTKVLV